MMKTSKRAIRLPLYIAIGFFILSLHTLTSQEDTLRGKALLDHLLVKNEVVKAEEALQAYITQYEHLPDSLSIMPYYVGKINRLQGSLERSLHQMQDFVVQLEKTGATEKGLYLAKISMSTFYDEVGEVNASLRVTEEALAHILKAQHVTQGEIGKVKYNLGVSYLTIDNLPKAKLFFQKALNDYESYEQTESKKLSDGYNAMGAVMWMSSKLDSASYYYDKASLTMEKASGDPIENLYYATVIKSNVSLLAHSQGHLSKALEVQNEVIRNYEKVIREIQSSELKDKAQRFQARAISNLSIFYNESGNISRANELLKYTFSKKKQFLEPTDDEVITTLIQIGQSEISLKSFEDARLHIQEALMLFEEKGEILPYWVATAYHGMAEIYIALKKNDSASYFFNKAAPLFEQSLGTNIDAAYLTYLRDKSQFETSLAQYKVAEKTAFKAYDYVLKNTGEESVMLSKQMLNLSKMYLQSKNYDKAILWSNKADSLLQRKKVVALTNTDSIKADFDRPLLILLNVQSKYQQKKDVSEKTLLNFIDELEEAVGILERRKTITVTPSDINQLLLEYKEINSFLKQLYLDLYTITTKETYLSSLLSVHESGIYNRIRTKLNYQDAIAFSDVPAHILNKEQQLKASFSKALSISETDEVLSFFEVEKEWDTFKNTLKQNYPRYYKMRYETIQIPIEDIVKRTPNRVSVIRYIFINQQLYAFIIHGGTQEFIAIDSKDLDQVIESVTSNQFDRDKLLDDLYLLYTKLWKPIEEKGVHNHVIIIPDGLLFNISFEMLSTEKIDTYDALIETGLLQDYTISYNYSLHTLSNSSRNLLEDNFIAFTPEFDQEMKEDYKLVVEDSLDIDQMYLTLLPQPFSVAIAENYNRKFKGDHYSNNKATKQLFVDHAGGHKIIHIGTHAESNNISPELSRLIFAKSIDSLMTVKDSDNSLYMYEIYNCDLTSELAVLTACETGKPSYQSGEGMISLAHAFNYAGSKSILTSLWKIDEQSSATIVGHFYDNLAKGMSKDDALKNAKITYLNQSDGRTLHPSYWAGLALMGNTTPLELTMSFWEELWWLWILLVFIVLVVFLYYYKAKGYKLRI